MSIPRNRAAPFLIRLLLVLGLLAQFGGTRSLTLDPSASDPARQVALAAGALCLADASAGQPGSVPSGHEHASCLLCQIGGAVPVLATQAWALAAWTAPGAGGDRVAAVAHGADQWPDYASRAPPGRFSLS